MELLMRQLFSSVCMLAMAALPLMGMAAPAPVLTQLPVAAYTATVDPWTVGYYGYDDQGQDLTDGVMDVSVGGGYWNWSPYVMWDGISPTIVFDLGASRQVDLIQGHFLTYPSAAVYLPLASTVSYSADNITYSAPVTVLTGYTLGDPLGHDQPVVLNLGVAGQGRYVKLELETPGRWIALGEVQLMTAVPEPGALTLAMAGVGVLALLGRRRKA
jgi:uncharacterized protein (TIGR03382 family)